jgi:hypothetical protein
VENPCYRCGKTVEEGSIFCPHCRAPQIRVPAAAVYSTAGPDVELTQIPVTPPTPPRSLQSLDWSHGLSAATLAGVIGVILTVFLAQAFSLGILVSGALAVVFYRRRAPYAAISIGKGARLGALSGTISFAILTIWVAITTLFYGAETLRSRIMEAMDQASKRPFFQMTPEQLAYMKTPEGLTAMLIGGIFTLLLLFVLLSGVGGALSAAWVRRRRP